MPQGVSDDLRKIFKPGRPRGRAGAHPARVGLRARRADERPGPGRAGTRLGGAGLK